MTTPLDRRFDRQLLQLAALQRAQALRDEALDAAWLGLRRAVGRAASAWLRVGAPVARRPSRA